MNFQPQHYMIVGGLLVAIGLQLGGLEHGWKDAATPLFFGGLLVQVGNTLLALYTNKPRDGESKTRRTDDSKTE